MKRWLSALVPAGIVAAIVVALAPSEDTPRSQAGPQPDCDASFAMFGGLSGRWEGSWMNTTFSSSGNLSVEATINADCTAEAVIEGVFGASEPVTVNATYRDENGTTVEFQDHPIFGDTTINIALTGVITVTGSDMHQGIESVTGTGTVTDDSIDLSLVLTFDNQSTANETITLSRVSTPTPSPTSEATSSPTPAGAVLVWGDSDCDEEISTRDNQALLREILDQNPLTVEPACPALGDSVAVSPASDGVQRIWGDWDCDGEITTRDNQALLREILDQNPLTVQPSCPDLGDSVNVS